MTLEREDKNNPVMRVKYDAEHLQGVYANKLRDFKLRKRSHDCVDKHGHIYSLTHSASAASGHGHLCRS